MNTIQIEHITRHQGYVYLPPKDLDHELGIYVICSVWCNIYTPADNLLDKVGHERVDVL